MFDSTLKLAFYSNIASAVGTGMILYAVLSKSVSCGAAGLCGKCLAVICQLVAFFKVLIVGFSGLNTSCRGSGDDNDKETGYTDPAKGGFLRIMAIIYIVYFVLTLLGEIAMR